MRRILGTTVIATALIATAVGTVGATTSQRVIRVGYVEYAGARQDRGVGQAAYEGFLRAVKQFGLNGRVLDVAPFVDPKAAFTTFARQRYDLVYDAAPYPLHSLFQVAATFPKTRFIVPDIIYHAVPGGPRNVQTFVLGIEQAGYLAGYLAGLMEKQRPGKHVIGSVGGMPIVQVDPYIAGYQAGARKADPGITTLNGYSHDFGGPAKCRAIALAQISRGAGAIFDVAGSCGLGALDAAKSKHVWGIGVDIDQSFLGPHILTSAVKRYDVALSTLLRELKSGTLRTGGTTFFGVRENGVGLGKISPKVPSVFRRAVERIRTQIAAGTIQVPTRIS